MVKVNPASDLLKIEDEQCQYALLVSFAAGNTIKAKPQQSHLLCLP